MYWRDLTEDNFNEDIAYQITFYHLTKAKAFQRSSHGHMYVAIWSNRLNVNWMSVNIILQKSMQWSFYNSFLLGNKSNRKQIITFSKLLDLSVRVSIFLTFLLFVSWREQEIADLQFGLLWEGNSVCTVY